MRWNPPNPITIDITPSQVTFIDPDGPPVVVPPVVYLRPDSRRVRVMSIGVPPNEGAPLRVELFTANAPPAGVSKLECPSEFFMQGLKTIIDRSLFRVRPTVLVRGSGSISTAFSGYERDVLRLALERAGAKQVLWPEDEARS